MAVGRTRANINVKGGGLLKARMMSPTASDTFVDWGYLGSTDIDDTHNMVDVVDEKGLNIEYLDGGQKVIIRPTLLQSDIDLINLLRSAGSAIYEFYYQVYLRNTKYQEWVMPLGRITAGVQLKHAAGSVRSIPVEIHGLAIKAALTRTPVAFNMNADEAIVVAENASAQGAPSDTASTVYSTAY
jgi:hypothetical protein